METKALALALLAFGLALPFVCAYLGVPVNTRDNGWWWW
jgi:hypothetical protein